MQQLLWVLWPSFIVAGVAESLFFTLINPQELYLFGEPVYFPALATYSVGFLAFWAICASSSLFTCFLQKTPDQTNGSSCGGRPTPPAGR